MSEKKFVDGLYLDPPRDGAPDFVIGKLAINVAQFRDWMVAYLKDNPNEKWIRMDLTRQKADPQKGTVALNDWKPAAKPEPAPEAFDDIPF